MMLNWLSWWGFSSGALGSVVVPIMIQGCTCGVMVKALDCGTVVSEFKLQSRYYVHFQANTLGKGMKPLILPAMG